MEHKLKKTSRPFSQRKKTIMRRQLITWGGKFPTQAEINSLLGRIKKMATDVRQLPQPPLSWLESRRKTGTAGVMVEDMEFAVSKVDHPSPFGSFGYASEAYSIEIPSGLSQPIDLVVPLSQHEDSIFIPNSIRLFWWDMSVKKFRLVPLSNSNVKIGVAWGKVAKAGIYLAIGYPTDLAIRAMLEVCSISLRFANAADSKSPFSLAQDLCNQLLSKPGVLKSENLQHYKTVIDNLHHHWPLPELILNFHHFDDILRPPWLDRPFPKWSNIGPMNVTGVIRCLAAHPTLPGTLFAAAEYGGVWKTVDGGGSWIPLMDDEQALHVGAIALCRSVPDVIYAATVDDWGDSPIRLYKSIDAGHTWTVQTAVPGYDATALAVHPNDPNIIYHSNSWGLNYSTDGGLTWAKPGYTTIDGSLEIIPSYAGIFNGIVDDVKIDYKNPDTIYLSVRNRGILKSLDHGVTWRQLAKNFTISVVDDSGVRANARFGAFRTILALGEQEGYGHFGTKLLVVKMQDAVALSYDGGERTWRPVAQNFGWDNQSYWDSCVAVAPANEDFVVAGGNEIDFVDQALSLNPHVKQIPDSLHQDQQSIAFISAEIDSFYFANDGAIGKCWNRGYQSVKISDGLIATQCQNVSVSQSNDLILASATNHTGTIRSRAGDTSTWDWIDGPELGVVEIDPDVPTLIFSSSGGGPVPQSPLRRSTDGGATWTTVAGPVADFLAISPYDTKFMFASSSVDGELLFSQDRGKTWNTYLKNDGTPLNLDTRGTYCCAWSALGTTAYFGTTGGRVWRYNAGQFLEINPPLPPQRNDGSFQTIRSIAVHPLDPSIVYVGYAGKESRPIWRGVPVAPGQYQWIDASGLYPGTSIPPSPVVAIVVDPWNSLRVFAATPLGLFYTEDEGQWWHDISRGIPKADISGMRLHMPSKTLVISTWGRGIFQSVFVLGDDFSPL